MMEERIRFALGTKIFQPAGRGGGGCISQGNAYQTDDGLVFVKRNGESGALKMFEGEFESLLALEASGCVKTPKPIKVLENPDGGAVLVMEYLDIQSLSGSNHSKLGEEMARLHLHNSVMRQKADQKQQSVNNDNKSGAVSQFGFHVETCCGYLPQENQWKDSWIEFFAEKINHHVRLAEEKYGDRRVGPAWAALAPRLPRLFPDGEPQPALLHGDLWGGNAGAVGGSPVIFDPASFYGHSEYDLAISKMFGGFSPEYFNSYHKIIPQQPGFKDRQKLYQMFHYINHWNHFGGGYRSSTLDIMEGLAKKYS